MYHSVKFKKLTPTTIRNLIIIAGSVIAGILGGFSITQITLSNGTVINIPKIEFAKEQVETQTDIGLNIEAPTVDSVDSGKINECPEESLECAKGSILPPLDISSPTTVYNSLINQCIDFDGAYGSQCYDEMAYFHYVYTGRWLSTAGTGGAYGIWDARDYNNQGNEYELIYDAKDIKAGDWVVFHNGVYGHVGMALGSYNNGYVALLGTNQGGYACPGGGSSANVINASLAEFSGAFRPRIWIQPEPTPEPQPEIDNIYKTGDTFGQYLLDHKLTDEEHLWGEDINYYNEQLRQQGILEYRNGKYWNNIPVGTEIKLVGK